jgi:uncharacterized protein YaaW (UPF0174 family)
MGKITLSIEELIGFVHGELPTAQIKQNLASAMLDAWLNNPHIAAKVEEQATKLAERKVQQMIDAAIKVDEANVWNGHKRSFSGWGAEILAEHFNNAMKTAGLNTGSGQTIRAMAEEVVRNYGDDYRKSWQKATDDLKPLVEVEVRKLIPQYVTEEYRERVAANFDEKRVDGMLQELVTKAIGSMLMSGALSFNAPAATPPSAPEKG